MSRSDLLWLLGCLLTLALLAWGVWKHRPQPDSLADRLRWYTLR